MEQCRIASMLHWNISNVSSLQTGPYLVVRATLGLYILQTYPLNLLISVGITKLLYVEITKRQGLR